MVSTLGLGALTDVATLDELVDGHGKAGEGVASLDQVTRFGAPQCPDSTLEWWLRMTSWTRDAGTIMRSTRQMRPCLKLVSGRREHSGANNSARGTGSDL